MIYNGIHMCELKRFLNLDEDGPTQKFYKQNEILIDKDLPALLITRFPEWSDDEIHTFLSYIHKDYLLNEKYIIIPINTIKEN